MQLGIYAIPQGKLHLTKLTQTALGKTEFEVSDANGKVFEKTIVLNVAKDSTGLTVNLWALTQALRKSNIIGVETTIVTSLAENFRFSERLGRLTHSFSNNDAYSAEDYFD